VKSKFSRRAFVAGAPLVGSGLYGAVTGASNLSDPVPTTALRVEELTSAEQTYADSPAIATNGNGAAWATWLDRRHGDKETITGRRYENGSWSSPFLVTPDEGAYESLRLACSPSGEPLAVWIKQTAGAWLLESALCSRGVFGAPVPIKTDSGRPANPALIPGLPGEFWVAWETYKQGQFSILLSRWHGGQWSEPLTVTAGGTNSYSPTLSVDRKSGVVWIAYSSLTPKGELAVYLANIDPSKPAVGDVREIARGGYLKRRPNFNTYPTVHCDREGRVWIAYEHDSNRSLRSESMRPSGGTAGNHWGTRECRVLCFKDNSLLQVVPADKHHLGDRVLTAENDHYPTFFEDSRGGLWLFSRNSGPLRRAWTLRLSRLDGNLGWTKPVDVLDTLRRGRLLRPAIAVKDSGTLWVLWQADNVLGKIDVSRSTPERKQLQWGAEEDQIPGNLGLGAQVSYDSVTLRSGIFALQLPFDPPQQDRPLKLLAASSPEAGSVFPPVRYQPARPQVARRKVTVQGTEYTLLYGNLHEHTLISRCWQGGDDGIPDDDYRYGKDIEGYDFAAITDHCYDLYAMKWREILRAADYYNDPPHFIALPAYEWTRTMYKDGVFPGNGHKNIIFAHTEDAARFVSAGGTVYSAFYPDSDHPSKVWALLRAKGIKDVVTIPHHSSDSDHPTNWDSHDPEYQTLVEIFQCRQSQEYEGCPRQAPFATMYNQSYVQDALRKGYRLGFIASGDHQNMGEGVAAVLVREVSRAGIVEALKARRCYGTTGDKIFLDFRVDGHFMGEAFTSSQNSQIEAIVDGSDLLESVTIFCNGRIVAEHSGSDLAEKKSFQLKLTDGTKDHRYYYLRAVQKNGEIAWSSPIWVNV
jgi:hypothetical protein